MRTILRVSLLLTLCSHEASAGGDMADSNLLESPYRELTAEGIAAHIERLASDEFEGRAPATPGERKTTTYIQQAMKAAGLSPMPDGKWLQPMELLGKTLGEDVEMRVRWDGGSLELALGADALIGSPHPVEGVDVSWAELVFVGHGVVAPEYGWDDYAGVDMEGKIALAVLADPGRVSEDEDFFKGRALTLYGTTSQKAEEAARRGAVGLIMIHDEEIIGYPWTTLQGGARNKKWGLAEPDEDPKPLFQAMISRDLADRLLSTSGDGYVARLEAASVPGFRAQTTGVSMSARFRVELESSTTNNVIGILPGSERPDEYLVYTAHWDHVGIGKEIDGDSIYNGAVDNATGSAVLLELASAFARCEPRPRRSIVFIATAAEEQGLLGAFHYASHPIYPLERTVGVINMDALFPFGDFNSMTVVALGSSELEDYLRVAAAAEGRGLEADPAPQQGAFFRSDHYPFAKKGVPALFSIGGPASEPEPTAEMIERFQNYMVSGYHKPADEYDAETWDMRGILGDARIFLRMGHALANDARFPNWYLDSEFRALRDAQMLGLSTD